MGSTAHKSYIILLQALLLTCVTTMRLKNLSDIYVLQRNNTFIGNTEEVLKKLNNIIEAGPDHLQIVTDFDLTLTSDPEDNKKVLNSFEMLRICPSVPQTYKDEDYKLFLQYKPIESNPDLSIEEKSKYLVEWYAKANILMRGLRFPRQELQDIARNGSDSYRDGVHELVLWSQRKEVPILVLSSGLGDAVVFALEAASLLSRNVKVVSNFLEINNQDIITGMKGIPIHSYNKDVALKNCSYEVAKNRNNIILMGDSLGDANMADSINGIENIIKIGFLSKKNEIQLNTYLEQFDIVLLNDQTMDVANQILILMDSPHTSAASSIHQSVGRQLCASVFYDAYMYSPIFLFLLMVL